jgi:hypothetical protein
MHMCMSTFHVHVIRVKGEECGVGTPLARCNMLQKKETMRLTVTTHLRLGCERYYPQSYLSYLIPKRTFRKMCGVDTVGVGAVTCRCRVEALRRGRGDSAGVEPCTAYLLGCAPCIRRRRREHEVVEESTRMKTKRARGRQREHLDARVW